MTDRGLAGWTICSVLVHVIGLGAAASAVSAVATATALPPAAEVELVRVEPPPAPAPPPPAPRPRRVIAAPPPVPQPAPPPAPAPALLNELAPLTPAPAPATSTPPSAMLPSSAPAMGGPAGAGKLFAGGDLLVPPGGGAGLGSGASGERGAGTQETGPARVASSTGGELTSLARPLGGYQVKPEYPESARRGSVEGVTMLRFLVTETGKVGEILVEKTAGHPDLDGAAMRAVKQWLFEPARRGRQAVAVWVTLPVRFQLDRR
jgi:protein TonB